MPATSEHLDTNTPHARGVPAQIVSSTETYSVGRQIGQGASGGVYLCRRESDGKMCALKAIRVDHLKMGSSNFAEETKCLFREIEILKTLKHPGIVELYDVVESGSGSSYIFLVMEYVPGGELFTHITDNPAFKDEQVVKYVMVQLIDAFMYMHSQNVIHRDCKAENVLVLSCESVSPTPEHSPLPAYPIVKVADFGLSKQITNSHSLATTWLGTPQYWSSEILIARDTGASYDGRVDIWSIGVLLFVMLCRRYPFPEVSKTSPLPMNERILRGIFDFNGVSRPISEEAKDLIKRLIVPDPDQRLSLEQALNHPWFADSVEAQRTRERWLAGGSSVEVVSEPSQDSSQPRQVPQIISSTDSAAIPGGNQKTDRESAIESVHNNQGVLVPRVSPRNPAGTAAVTTVALPIIPNFAVHSAEGQGESGIPLMELASCQAEITRTLNRVAQSLRSRPGTARVATDLLRRARELHFLSSDTISEFAVTAGSVEDILMDTQSFVEAKKPKLAIECLEEVRQFVLDMHQKSEHVQNEYRRLSHDVSRLLDLHSTAAVAVSASLAPPAEPPAESASTPPSEAASNALVLVGRAPANVNQLSESKQLELLDFLGVLNLASTVAATGEGAASSVTARAAGQELVGQSSLVLAAGDNGMDLQREFAWMAVAARELRKVDAILERCRLFWSNVEHCVLRLNQFKTAATRLLENARNSESLYARYLERMGMHRQFWASFRSTCTSYANRSQIEYQLSMDEAHRLADVVDQHLNL